MPATVRTLLDEDVPAAAAFLHTHLNPRVSVAAWERLFRPPWPAPDHGLGALLEEDGEFTGVYAAVHATREIDGAEVAFCNLAALCVLPGSRSHTLRLVRALLRDKDRVLTDLSPSGNVVALNERLGFARIDTRTRLVPNLPGPAPRGARVLSDPDAIARALTGRERRYFDDHREAAAARHLAVQHGDRTAYLVYRRDRRRGLPLFATPLHVGGDRDLLRRAWPAVRGRLLRAGLPATLAEPRLLGFEPRLGVEWKRARPRMVRGHHGAADDIDYLYSELVLVEW